MSRNHEFLAKARRIRRQVWGKAFFLLLWFCGLFFLEIWVPGFLAIRLGPLPLTWWTLGIVSYGFILLLGWPADGPGPGPQLSPPGEDEE